MNGNKKAIIYLRVSSGKQAEKELPIESQQRECEAKAIALNAEVVKIYSDKGLSGRTDARPDFQKAIRYCETFDVDYFITWSTSRFARNRGDAYFYKLKLQKASTKIVYISTNIDESSPTGNVLAGIFEVFDEFYSSQISSDTRRSLVQIAKEGYWSGGRTPFGYQTIVDEKHPKKRKKLIPHPGEAKLVNKIFDMKINGLGSKSIAIALNEQGYSQRGKAWIKTTILNLLRSEVIIGKRIFGKTTNNGIKLPREDWLILNSHEPIIDQSKWDYVQTLLSIDHTTTDKGSHKSTWRFTGLLECGLCGSSLQIESAKGRSDRYYYYNCRKYQQTKSCKSHRMNADQLEDFLIDTLSERIFDYKSLKDAIIELNELAKNWGKKYKSKRSDLVNKINTVKDNNRRLYGFFEDPNGPANLADFLPRIRENNETIKTLEFELSTLEDQKAPSVKFTVADINDLRQTLINIIKENANPKKVRALMGSFIESIAINEESLRISYNPEALITTNLAVHSKAIRLPNLDSNQEPSD